MGGSTLKGLAGTRALKLGHYVGEFTTPGVGHILKNAGCEFVFLDMEHSGMGFEALAGALRFFETARLPVVVRPAAKSYEHLARALDAGAEGLVPPMMGSAEECRRVLDCMKYTPDGSRGVALGIAHDNYTGGNVMEKLKAANQRTSLFALIETREGVENAEAIAALDGVDCLWVGNFDLSSSLGLPGQFDHPDFVRAVDAVIAVARKHGKALGRMAMSVEESVAYARQGFEMICYSGDVWLLGAAVRSGIERIRAEVAS